MRDGHFREDENELPYLVYERRDSYSQDDSYEDYEWGDSRKRKARSAPLELHFTDIPFWEFPSYVRRLNLSANHKQNIISSVEIHPKNSTFSIHQQLDEIRMSFKVKNEYLTTELTVRYDCGSCAIEYVYGSTRHDGLESMQWFSREVRKVENQMGYKYEFCYNGQEFSTSNGRLVIKDNYESMVMFEKDGDDDHYGYRVDFLNRKLEEDHTYPFHEYYDFFLR